MATGLWTLLKNGNKVNVLGYKGALEWRDSCRDLWNLVSPPSIFKYALEDPNNQVVQIQGEKHYWVLARISE